MKTFLRQKTYPIIIAIAAILAFIMVQYSTKLAFFAVGGIFTLFFVVLYPEIFFGLWTGGMMAPLFFFYPAFGSIRGLSYVPLLAVFLYILKTRKRIIPPLNTMIVVQILFIGLLVAGIFWAPDRRVAFSKAHHFISLNVMIPIIGTLYFHDEFTRIKRLIIALAAALIFVSLSGFYFLHLGAIKMGHMEAFVQGPINYGRSAGAACIFLLGYIYFFQTKFWKKLIAAGLMAIQLLGTILSGQRGVFFAFIIGIFAISFSRINIHNKKLLVKICLWFLIALVLLGLFFHYLPEERIIRYINFWHNPFTDKGITARLHLYDASFDFFLNSPFIGIGTAGFRENYIWDTWPHNIFLECMAEWGILGLALLLSFLFLTFKYALFLIRSPSVSREIKNVASLLFGCFIFYLSSAQVSSNIIGNASVWLYAGLLTVLYIHSRQQTPLETSNEK